MTEQAQIESKLEKIKNNNPVDFGNLITILVELTGGVGNIDKGSRYHRISNILRRHELTFSDLYSYKPQQSLMKKFAKACPDFPDFKDDPQWRELIDQMHSN